MNMMDINYTPLSYYGSYMSIVSEENSVWLKSLRGKSKHHMRSLEFIPIEPNGKQIDYSIYTDFYGLTFHGEKNQKIEFCFIDDKRIAISGENCSLNIDAHPKANFEYSYLLKQHNMNYCIVNSYKNYTKYLIYPTQGNINLHQYLNIDSTGSMNESHNESIIKISPDANGKFVVILEEIQTNGALPTIKEGNFNCWKKQSKDSFDHFCKDLPIVSDEYRSVLLDAAYVLWSSTVKATGNLKRDTVYASNKNFPGSWSWDHCFISVGLGHFKSDLAKDQMFTIFDHQDELGQLPGSVSDSTIRWNFSKPPVQGLFFQKMEKQTTFSKKELLNIYRMLQKQVDYYFKYKDSNQDGICEYHHGNDSGQDNSTVFKEAVIIDSPDLTAFLIKAIDYLAELAERLGNYEEHKEWILRSDELTKLFIEYFIIDDQPTARETLTGKAIQSNSILPLISIILGNKLPAQTLETMINKLSSPSYLTEWGIATEAIDSKDYQEDAYWRGAIWGPTTLLICDALEEIGELALAKEIAKKYCELIKKNGFPENFNAINGAPLRDRSFSWTASSFIHLLSVNNF